jgi:hypothetical protein
MLVAFHKPSGMRNSRPIDPDKELRTRMFLIEALLNRTNRHTSYNFVGDARLPSELLRPEFNGPANFSYFVCAARMAVI